MCIAFCNCSGFWVKWSLYCVDHRSDGYIDISIECQDTQFVLWKRSNMGQVIMEMILNAQNRVRIWLSNIVYSRWNTILLIYFCTSNYCFTVDCFTKLPSFKSFYPSATTISIKWWASLWRKWKGNFWLVCSKYQIRNHIHVLAAWNSFTWRKFVHLNVIWTVPHSHLVWNALKMANKKSIFRKRWH